jgi:hypothetical protein
MIDFYQCVTADDDKAKYGSDIWNALYALRSREDAIAGGSTSSTGTTGVSSGLLISSCANGEFRKR